MTTPVLALATPNDKAATENQRDYSLLLDPALAEVTAWKLPLASSLDRVSGLYFRGASTTPLSFTLPATFLP